MRKGMMVVACAATLLGMGAGQAGAATPVRGPSNNTVDLRVVNKHATPVVVYVQDAKGRTHYLGRVSPADFKILEIPGALAAMGDLRIDIFPRVPVGSLLGDPDGVRTEGFTVKLGDAINVFVETNLLRSQVEFERG